MLLRLALCSLFAALLVLLPGGPAAAVIGCEDLVLVAGDGGAVRATVPASLGLEALPADAFTAVRDGVSVPVQARRLPPSEVAVSILLAGSPGTTAGDLAAGQGAALELLVGLPAEVRTSLVVGGDPAPRLSPLSVDRGAAVELLSRSDLGGTTDPAAGFLAAQQLPARTSNHLVVFTDGRSPLPEASGPGTQVHGLHYGSAPASPAAIGCPSDPAVALLTGTDAVVRRVQGTYELRVPGGYTEIRLSAGQVDLSALAPVRAAAPPALEPSAPAPQSSEQQAGQGAPPSTEAGGLPRSVLVVMAFGLIGVTLVLLRRRGGRTRDTSRDVGADVPQMTALLAGYGVTQPVAQRSLPPAPTMARPVPAEPRDAPVRSLPSPETPRAVPATPPVAPPPTHARPTVSRKPPVPAPPPMHARPPASAKPPAPATPPPTHARPPSAAEPAAPTTGRAGTATPRVPATSPAPATARAGTGTAPVLATPPPGPATMRPGQRPTSAATGTVPMQPGPVPAIPRPVPPSPQRSPETPPSMPGGGRPRRGTAGSGPATSRPTAEPPTPVLVPLPLPPPPRPLDDPVPGPVPVALQLADLLEAGRPPAGALRALAAVSPAPTAEQLVRAAAAVDDGAQLPEALDAVAPPRRPSASRIRSELAEAAWALRLARSTGAHPWLLLRAAAAGCGAREEARWEASDARLEAWVMRGCLLAIVPAAVAVRLLIGGRPGSSGLLAALALATVGAVWVWASTTPPYSPLPWRWRPHAGVVPPPGEVLEDAAVWAVLHDDVRKAVDAVFAEPDGEQARAVVQEAGRRVDAGASASQALHELADEAWGTLVEERPRLVLASVPAFVLCLAPAAALVLLR